MLLLRCSTICCMPFLGVSFLTWAASFPPERRPFFLVVSESLSATETKRRLGRCMAKLATSGGAADAAFAGLSGGRSWLISRMRVSPAPLACPTRTRRLFVQASATPTTPPRSRPSFMRRKRRRSVPRPRRDACSQITHRRSRSTSSRCMRSVVMAQSPTVRRPIPTLCPATTRRPSR